MLDHSNLEEFADAAAYDDENGLDDDAAIFLAAGARFGGPVLDLACGTGRMTIPLARAGLRCVGVDLVEPMLARARDKSQGLPAAYLCGDALTLALDERFGLVVLTGHAFQAFLTDDDQRALLASVHRHLRPGGGFVFETRNPGGRVLTAEERIDWARSYTTASGARIEAHCRCRYDEATAIQHIVQHRREVATGVEKLTRIALRYSDDARVRALLDAAGFAVIDAYGEWTRTPITPACKELIYVCERR